MHAYFCLQRQGISIYSCNACIRTLNASQLPLVATMLATNVCSLLLPAASLTWFTSNMVWFYMIHIKSATAAMLSEPNSKGNISACSTKHWFPKTRDETLCNIKLHLVSIACFNQKNLRQWLLNASLYSGKARLQFVLECHWPILQFGSIQQGFSISQHFLFVLYLHLSKPTF